MNGAAKATASDGVSIGDTVGVRDLSDDKTALQFMISAEGSDPSKGVIHHKKPIAEARLQMGRQGSYPRVSGIR